MSRTFAERFVFYSAQIINNHLEGVTTVEGDLRASEKVDDKSRKNIYIKDYMNRFF